jgi:2-keto-4-pentenoate hydratase/2-oxohepta-3-ene-1,7-dioic acid hydratase in catechol pathway
MKIICIGRNYADHIRELANEKPDEPVIFLKPESALVLDNRPVRMPSFSNDVHHELEIVLRVCKAGKDIPVQEANGYFDAMAAGIDFTARDLQNQLKSKGLPWEIAKAFDDSAPVSGFIEKSRFSDVKAIRFSLKVNGQIRQSGDTGLMLFHFDEIISAASRYFRLDPGDLIFTGTPAGVGAVRSGDCLEAFIEDKQVLKFFIQ